MKSPVVVIVGRPNVGKSTLFNRLVGKREAIVDDISGVTRDRNYGEVEWNGKEFRLIDTGGYVPNSTDLFETAIREQVEIAILEADAIIFMVDVRIGISPIDVEIVNILRSANKDFYLLVNKVDSENFEAAVSEFYKLGVDRTFDLSALVGRKTGDFLDVLTSGFPANIEEKEDTRLKIAILGRPNVGKSSLANSLLGYDRSIVTDIPGTTRDSIDSVLKYYGKEIILVDTAGLRKKKRIDESIEFYSAIRTLKAVGECDVAIVLIDAKIGLDKQDQKIIDEVIRRRKGLILAVNKWDLIEKETNTAGQYEKSINEKLGSIDYVPVIFISALTKQRIFKVIELSNQIGEERKKKIPTNTLNNVLLPEIEKNPPPATGTGKEVKIKYITQGGEHYPVFIFFSNRPKDIPENFKRFLEKLIRKNFGFKGVSFTMVFKTK
ncbi:MAG: ribosome biogenesis GTPase Der [Ignavibacteria bacterium GWA2_35_9]|nr:MAG: ribosome biogenesis GTPase Der [Ignavibacteria bacterium GWA2_35_9]OGU45952.1 MAG: ribosome biogenesis GTPase Der [Ignavibacteria bacterium GWB2_36_8]OGU49618.1 MAG: ribosome biogenesis GTPase Der [Ignavibacteria bacterium GWC2_36_12]